MEWAKINNVKVIYAGSCSKHHDPSDSPYAMTKFLGEEICKLYKKSFNVNVEIARFYNVYGPDEPVDEKFGNVIGIWRAKINKNSPLPIVGDGNQKRDFTHVLDIVDGLFKISNTEIKHDDAWEIGTGINYSINQLYSMFKKKYSISSVNIPDQRGNYRETLRVNDDLINLLNWQPKDRLREYISNLKTI
jgi:UDP-glucose 4-epimerase